MRLREDVAYCSACFQAKPGQPHIDFEVAWDGPVIDAAAAQQIDDLCLCPDCFAGAASLSGYSPDGLAAKVAELEAQLAEAAQRAFQAETQLQRIREAVPAAKVHEAPQEPVKRGPGRPRKNPVPA